MSMTETRKATADDSTSTKKVDATDASTKLSAEANDKTQVKKPADAVTDKVKEAVETKAKETFGHHNNARAAYNEMDGLLTAKKPLTDKISVPGTDGKPAREITVGERLKELKHTINTEANGAVVEASKVDQKVVSTLLTSTLMERNNLAKELGLNSTKLSVESINQAISQTGDATRLAKLQELSKSQTQVDHYKTLENLPGFTKLVYAQYKAGGYTNENTPVERDDKGRLKVDQRDVLDAMSLLSEAGANNVDLRNHELYLQSVNKVFPRLENSSVKIQTITTEMENAIKFGREGNKVEQEKALKAAVAQADQVNVPVLAQLVKDPSFNGRNTEAVLTEMANSVVMASTARLQYAQFLAEQGRFGEAQVQTLRVKSECPDVMYNLTEDGKVQIGADGKPLYNNSRFVQLDKLDQQVAQSSNFDPNKLNADIQNFSSQFAKLQGDATKTSDETSLSKEQKAKNNAQVQADLRNLSASMNGQLNTQKQQLTADKVALDAEKNRLAAELKALPTKDVITEDARKIEQARIERQISIIELQEKELEAHMKANTQNTQLVRYLEANYDLAREDRSAARAKLAEIEKSDPDFVNARRKELDDLKKAAEEPGWWDRWGKKAFIIGAVVVGVAGGIWLGPGCIATGVAAGSAAAAAVGGGALVTGALMTAGAVGGVAVVTAAGAGAGGVLLGGGRLLADHTGGTDGRTTMWQDVKDGAYTGGVAAMWSAAPGIPGAVNAGRATHMARALTTVEAAGTATAATTRVAQVSETLAAASKIEKITNAATFGLGTTTVLTGLDKVTGRSNPNATLGQESLAFGQQFAINSTIGYVSGPLTSSGRIANIFSKAGVASERVPYLTGALLYQGISQPINTWVDYSEYTKHGANWDGRSSTALIGPSWGMPVNNEANSLGQATMVRDRWAQRFDGLSFYTNEVNSRPKGNIVVNGRSVFDDAERFGIEREQNK